MIWGLVVWVWLFSIQITVFESDRILFLLLSTHCETWIITCLPIFGFSFILVFWALLLNTMQDEIGGWRAMMYDFKWMEYEQCWPLSTKVCRLWTIGQTDKHPQSLTKDYWGQRKLRVGEKRATGNWKKSRVTGYWSDALGRSCNSWHNKSINRSASD